MYPTLNTVTASFSLTITKNSKTFSNCPIKIEILSVAFPAFRLIPARTVNKFSAVYSASAKSLP
jgi:hypothetical protein